MNYGLALVGLNFALHQIQRIEKLLFPLLPIPSPVSVINKTIEEDKFDIPEVPMEED